MLFEEINKVNKALTRGKNKKQKRFKLLKSEMKEEPLLLTLHILKELKKNILNNLIL